MCSMPVSSSHSQPIYSLDSSTRPNGQEANISQLDLALITEYFKPVLTKWLIIARALRIPSSSTDILRAKHGGDSVLLFFRMLNVWQNTETKTIKSATQAIKELSQAVHKENPALSRAFDDLCTRDPSAFLKHSCQSHHADTSDHLQSVSSLNIPLLCDHLNNLRSRAIYIGAGLGLSVDALDLITCDVNIETKDRLSLVLNEWQHSALDKSMEKLESVLKNTLGGSNPAAAKAFKEICDKNPKHFILSESQVRAQAASRQSQPRDKISFLEELNRQLTAKNKDLEAQVTKDQESITELKDFIERQQAKLEFVNKQSSINP